MNIAAPANRRRIAEMLARLFRRRARPPSCACSRYRESRKSRSACAARWVAGPGAEILRRDVLAGDLAQIVVDVLRVDRMPVALLVEVLEQLVARQVAAALTMRASRRSLMSLSCRLPLLPRKLKWMWLPSIATWRSRKRRQPEALVGFGVFGVADAEEGQLHQPHDGGQHALSRQPAAASDPPRRARGSAADTRAKISSLPYLASSRTSRQRG